MTLTADEWDVSQTMNALGLRVQNLILEQDSEDARLQQEATSIDEHDALYPNSLQSNTQELRLDRFARSHHSSRSSSSSSSLPEISQLFRRPTTNNHSTLLRSPPTNQSVFNSIDADLQIDEQLNNFQDDPIGSPIDLSDLDLTEHQQDQDDEDSDGADQTAISNRTTPSHYALATPASRESESRRIENVTIPGSTYTRPILIEEDDEDDEDDEGAGDITTLGRSPGRVASDEEENDEDRDSVTVEDSVTAGSLAGRVTSSDEEGDENREVSALDHTVERLYQQFQLGHNGCTPEQHQEQLDRHTVAVGVDHFGLSNVSGDPNFPSVLASSDLISPERLSQQAAPTSAQWQAMFCGVCPERTTHEHPMSVCLHEEDPQPIETDVAFDIDSFMGFFRSLAAVRPGILYQPTPLMRQNITTDVHLQTIVHDQAEDPTQTPRASLAMLRDVPHCLLGRVVSADDITIHVLFPHLSVTQEKFTSMTQEQSARWLDRIFHPAVHRFCPAHLTQHLPASHRHALDNSRAHQVEGRQVETASYQTQRSISYFLQPEYLDQIWTEILRTIDHTPGLMDFREPQLFFSAKGTKLLFKTNPSKPTLLDAMENFQSYIERVIDMDLVFQDRFYVDLGKEICPYLSLVHTQQNTSDDEAQVYLWKRCCLQHYLRDMYDGQPPPTGGPGQRYYDQNMLYDAASLTSLTPKRSKLRAGGLIYSQFYGSVKEISDATKRYPFDNDGLEELALDPQIRQGARHLARGHRRDVKIIERAYRASKQRARDALTDSRRKSFGIREEHRMTWTLYLALLARLQREDAEDGDIAMAACPPYAWAVKTEVYLDFLWRVADKFATGFEVVRARCHRDLVTWEQTKIMAMFLRCLRFVFGGHQLERESALWWSRRETPARTWYGLGFSNTLPRYKYCWLEPRLDWDQLVFREDITDRVLFGNAILRGQYLRNGGQVQGFFSTTRQLEVALSFMDRHHENPTIRTQLLQWMIHICLRQFRIDVLSTVRSEIDAEHREQALEGDQPFCHEYLDRIMTAGLWLVSGNRSELKDVATLVRYLFDYDDDRQRAHWEDRPFRKLYRRARTALDIRHRASRLGTTFTRRLRRHLLARHWILPYPFKDGLMQTTKEGRRMWYSIEPRPTVEGPLDRLSPDQWRWAQKSWRVGSPAAVDAMYSWSKEEWQNWIRRHSDMLDV